VRYLVALLVVLLGVAAVVLGGADDSPGLQLIGALLIAAAVARIVQWCRRTPRSCA
jgi:hypothetical protein